MTQETLGYSLVKTGDYQDKAFIMIHGWQGNKDSFKTIVNLLGISNCTWYFPEAPYMIEGNPDKRTWAREVSPGEWEVEKAKKLLKLFIKDKVLSKYDSNDVFIMGFSQGAAVCYELILSFDYPLGGIFPIAGFMRDFPGATDKISLDSPPKQQNTPILIGHGKDDDIVFLEASEKAYNLLKQYCRNIELYIYNGRHKIGIEYLKKVKEMVAGKKEHIQ